MGKNGKHEVSEIMTNKDDGRYGPPMEHWKPDFKNAPSNNIIDKLYDFPGKANIIGNFVRGCIKDEVQADSLAYWACLCIEHHDDVHLDLIFMKLASSAGIRGVARTEVLMGGTGILAPDIYRTAKGMPKQKNEEKVYRNSDFREKEDGRDNLREH